jgi:hypothetical protein
LNERQIRGKLAFFMRIFKRERAMKSYFRFNRCEHNAVESDERMLLASFRGIPKRKTHNNYGDLFVRESQK